jgi:hypothetical protein
MANISRTFLQLNSLDSCHAQAIPVHKAFNEEMYYSQHRNFNHPVYGKVELLKENLTSRLIMAISSIFTDRKDAATYISCLQARMTLNHQNLLYLLDYACLPKIKLCSTDFKITAYLEFPLTNLARDIKERQTREEYFTVDEITGLVSQLIEVLAHLHSRDLFHGNICPKMVQHRRANKLFILLDHFTETRSLENFHREQVILSDDIFLAPELHTAILENMYNPEQKRAIDYTKCDVFSLGLLILHIGLMKSVQDIYTQDQGINREKLEAYIKLFEANFCDKKVILLDLVKMMLQICPENRPRISKLRDILKVSFENSKSTPNSINLANGKIISSKKNNEIPKDDSKGRTDSIGLSNNYPSTKRSPSPLTFRVFENSNVSNPAPKEESKKILNQQQKLNKSIIAEDHFFMKDFTQKNHNPNIIDISLDKIAFQNHLREKPIKNNENSKTMESFVCLYKHVQPVRLEKNTRHQLYLNTSKPNIQPLLSPCNSNVSFELPKQKSIVFPQQNYPSNKVTLQQTPTHVSISNTHRSSSTQFAIPLNEQLRRASNNAYNVNLQPNGLNQNCFTNFSHRRNTTENLKAQNSSNIYQLSVNERHKIDFKQVYSPRPDLLVNNVQLYHSPRIISVDELQREHRSILPNKDFENIYVNHHRLHTDTSVQRNPFSDCTNQNISTNHTNVHIRPQKMKIFQSSGVFAKEKARENDSRKFSNDVYFLKKQATGYLTQQKNITNFNQNSTGTASIRTVSREERVLQPRIYTNNRMTTSRDNIYMPK